MLSTEEIVKLSAILVAIIGACTTISVLFFKGITTFFWEKYFYKYKLHSDHSYEQQKKIKEAISKHKVPLLECAEALNYRLWNFTDNADKGWLKQEYATGVNNGYYTHSFAYRFLSLYAWSRKVELELVYMDSTLAEQDDLDFVKYIKVMRHIVCDASIFGKQYDCEIDKDHFFKGDLNALADMLITETGIVSYDKFKKMGSKFSKVYNFLHEIDENKKCNKWYVINILHYSLIIFLSRYGYDYQRTSTDKILKLKEKTKGNPYLFKLKTIYNNYCLSYCLEVGNVTNILFPEKDVNLYKKVIPIIKYHQWNDK